jgi:hypothetical protein
MSPFSNNEMAIVYHWDQIVIPYLFAVNNKNPAVYSVVFVVGSRFTF